jgi:Pectate lyase superfamily protein
MFSRLLVIVAEFLILGSALSAVPCTAGPLDESFSGPFASWKNVKDFGAVGNGVTDDTAAIQTALNALKNVHTNTWSVLYFPAGTYRITRPLTTSRSSNQDYFGAEIIGADPNTTILAWDGPSGGTMLRWDAWYDKVSRLTFDGKGTAGWGIVRAGGFSTYSEMSDLIFKGIAGVCLNLGNNEPNGTAEIMVLRDRFYRCGTGVTTWNWNTLDIYIWYSYFEDNDYAIRNAAGAFHSYENRFVRSQSSDLSSGANANFSVVNNMSLGSKSFAARLQGNFYFQGNKIYATTGIPLDLTNTTPITLIDNVIRGPDRLPPIQLGSAETNSALFVGNTFASNLPFPVRVEQQQFNHGVGASYLNGHGIQLAADSDPSTYAILGMWRPVTGFQWNAPFGSAKIATSYALTSSPSDSSKDPTDWALYGSNDWGSTWTELDMRSGEIFSSRMERKNYAIATPAAYAIYELRVLRTMDGSTPAKGGFVSIAEFELLNSLNENLVVDPRSLLMGADEFWGKLYIDQETVVSPSSIQIPIALQPWDFAATRASPVIEVGAFTGDAIQSAINEAAAKPAGSNPVIHLKKGTYKVASTITVPSQVTLSIVGDGASENGSGISWTGSTKGPVIWLKGPSRATLRDFTINGNPGADGLLIDKADQEGGRVYGYQVQASGAWAGGGHLVDAAFDIDGVERSDVNIIGSGFNNFLTGVRVTGGPLRSTGQPAPGRISFLTGASSAGNRLFDIKSGGTLVATAYWYEGDWNYVAPLLDLPSTSSGSLVLATMVWATQDPFPIVRTNNFKGSLAILGTDLNTNASPTMSFTGSGSQTDILTASSSFDDTALGDMDRTDPPGAIALITNSGTLPAMTNGVFGPHPSPAFVKKQIGVIRNIQTNPAVEGPAGATDVKLLRVWITAGDNRAAVKIIGTAGTLATSSAAPESGGQSREPALAQEPAVEDRACITAAAAKLPPVKALKIERSRVVPQPHTQGQRNSKLYHVKVEIDASVAGQTSTYVYNCIRDGQLTVIQPLGMR